jgi:hypothetical protein
MKNYFTLLLILICVIACKKENKEEHPIPIIIDTINKQFIFVDVKQDTSLYFLGKDSVYGLDVNKDDHYDFKISVEGMDFFGGQLINSKFNIETLNNYSFILIDSIYPKVMSIGDTIRSADNWKTGKYTLIEYSDDCCPPQNFGYTIKGSWPANIKKYVAFRTKEKYGWIGIEINNYRWIIIYDYYILK